MYFFICFLLLYKVGSERKQNTYDNTGGTVPHTPPWEERPGHASAMLSAPVLAGTEQLWAAAGLPARHVSHLLTANGCNGFHTRRYGETLSSRDMAKAHTALSERHTATGLCGIPTRFPFNCMNTPFRGRNANRSRCKVTDIWLKKRLCHGNSVRRQNDA